MYICPICQQDSGSAENLKKHIKRHHGTLSQTGRCPHINCKYRKTFGNLYDYLKHIAATHSTVELDRVQENQMEIYKETNQDGFANEKNLGQEYPLDIPFRNDYNIPETSLTENLNTEVNRRL